MGTYIYKYKSKKHSVKVTLQDGTIAEANQIKYIYKDSKSFDNVVGGYSAWNDYEKREMKRVRMMLVVAERYAYPTRYYVYEGEDKSNSVHGQALFKIDDDVCIPEAWMYDSQWGFDAKKTFVGYIIKESKDNYVCVDGEVCPECGYNYAPIPEERLKHKCSVPFVSAAS